MREWSDRATVRRWTWTCLHVSGSCTPRFCFKNWSTIYARASSYEQHSQPLAHPQNAPPCLPARRPKSVLPIHTRPQNKTCLQFTSPTRPDLTSLRLRSPLPNAIAHPQPNVSLLPPLVSIRPFASTPRCVPHAVSSCLSRRPPDAAEP
jgi:hypothetical protein